MVDRVVKDCFLWYFLHCLFKEHIFVEEYCTHKINVHLFLVNHLLLQCTNDIPVDYE